MWVRVKETTIDRKRFDDEEETNARAVTSKPRHEYQSEKLFDAIADTVTIRIYERKKDRCASR
jgi:hypothetical protein